MDAPQLAECLPVMHKALTWVPKNHINRMKRHPSDPGARKLEAGRSKVQDHPQLPGLRENQFHTPPPKETNPVASSRSKGQAVGDERFWVRGV